MAPQSWCWMKNDSWSATATWVCSGLLLAGGLIPCVLYTIATHHFLWAALLTLSLLIVTGIPVYLCLFAGYRSLQLFAGSLYVPAGLWVLLWSLLPEAQTYIKRGLLATGAFLFLLGLLFTYLFFSSRKAAEEGEGAGAGEGEAVPE
jgi:predicted membrane channel-forming protein YqfA (hemolysin III family)